jgi:hypothetical protein
LPCHVTDDCAEIRELARGMPEFALFELAVCIVEFVAQSLAGLAVLTDAIVVHGGLECVNLISTGSSLGHLRQAKNGKNHQKQCGASEA